MNDVAIRFDPQNAEDWSTRITACWRQSVQAIFDTGNLITEAKAALEHGQFRKMCKEQLPFGERTAQRLMAIAADERLANPTHASLLPPSWMTLYEITRLDDANLEQRIADGTIRPDMDRKDISTAVKQTVRATREFLLGQQQLAAPTLKYGVIVEDFEWDHQTWSEKGRDRAAENHYPVSKDAHTAAEIVKRTAPRFECAAPDCVLYMWTTLQHLAIAIDVLRQRGFDYRSSYAWGKDKIGLGYWSREKHEILLVGVKGKKIAAPALGTQFDSLIYAPRAAHSEKPDVFLEMIERHFPTLPKIELNRRGAPRPGWDAWGNEAEQNPIGQVDASSPPTGEEDVDDARQCADRPAPVVVTPSVGAAGAPEPDDLEIPAFLRRGEAA